MTKEKVGVFTLLQMNSSTNDNLSTSTTSRLGLNWNNACITLRVTTNDLAVLFIFFRAKVSPVLLRE